MLELTEKPWALASPYTAATRGLDVNCSERSVALCLSTRCHRRVEGRAREHRCESVATAGRRGRAEPALPSRFVLINLLQEKWCLLRGLPRAGCRRQVGCDLGLEAVRSGSGLRAVCRGRRHGAVMQSL